MKILRASFTVFSVLFAVAGWCQLNVYKTYDDYVNHKAKSYGDVEFKKWKGDENTVLAFERKGKDDVEVECAQIGASDTRTCCSV